MTAASIRRLMSRLERLAPGSSRELSASEKGLLKALLTLGEEEQVELARAIRDIEKVNPAASHEDFLGEVESYAQTQPTERRTILTAIVTKLRGAGLG